MRWDTWDTLGTRGLAVAVPCAVYGTRLGHVFYKVCPKAETLDFTVFVRHFLLFGTHGKRFLTIICCIKKDAPN